MDRITAMSIENVREYLRKYGKDGDIIEFTVSSATVKEAAADLGTEEGRIGYSYFKSRGLEDATIEKFGLGWSLSSRTSLLDAARKAGYKAHSRLQSSGDSLSKPLRQA